MAAIEYPKKKRDIHTNHFDSTVWDSFKFRDDDIVIGTYAKSGTTQIVSQLLFKGEEDLPVSDMSPWVDLRVPPAPVKLEMLEGQTHRRFVKTHLPVDALDISPKAKYVYVARDGRDVAWSLRNHHETANDMWYAAMNESPGLVGEPMPRPEGDIISAFHVFLDRDGYPWWPFFSHIKSWWDVRHLPNVLLVNFADLKANMEGEIRRVAKFLEIDVEKDKWPAILEHCSFEYMRDSAPKSVPLAGAFWENGSKSFLNKGVNGRWRDKLTAEDAAKYEALALKEMGEDCAAWLSGGRLNASKDIKESLQ